jgi:BirA family biotin operon repressor/biotin-[acetyl-CoA-carboxylase] ligase
VDDWRRAWRIPALHVFERVPSTNDVLRTEAARGAASGTSALAELQTAGRGQHGRRWEAGAGQSLLMSVLLRTGSAQAPGAVPIRVGLAAAAGIEAACGVHVRLKWPNDLIVGGHKLGGVLCEATTTGSSTSIVAGIGINVAQREEDFSQAVASIATSLRIAGAADVQRSALAAAILERLLAAGDRIALALDAQELAAYSTRDALAGRAVEIDGRPAGTAVGISEQGELRVRNAAGLATVHTGRVRIAGARSAAHERAP